MERGPLVPTNHKLAPNWAWRWRRDPISKF